MLGRILNALRAPGFVRPMEYSGEYTEQSLKIRTSPRYTILTINGLEFYFLRESGRFDGIGAMSINYDTGLNRCGAEHIQRSKKEALDLMIRSEGVKCFEAGTLTRGSYHPFP